MDLVNLLLEQPIILATIGLAWLIFFVAIAIQFVQLARARWRRSQRQKASAVARRAALRSARAKAAAAANATITENGASVMADGGAGDLASESMESVQTGASDADESPEVSGEMQALLSDVFVDEDAAARYAILIDGLEEVDAHDLSLALHAVADQLRYGRKVTSRQSE